MFQSALLLKQLGIKHYFFGKTTGLTEYFDVAPSVVKIKQVHGSRVIHVDGNTPSLLEGDAMISASVVTLSLGTADCLPVLFYDPVCRVAAAAHAGWIGLRDEILLRTLEAFTTFGSSFDDIIVSIGPHIRACCYDVSIDRVEQFEKRGFNRMEIAKYRDNRWYLVLNAIAGIQLKQAGIKDAHIDVSTICTKDSQDFYSHRRGEMPGERNISIIYLT